MQLQCLTEAVLLAVMNRAQPTVSLVRASPPSPTAVQGTSATETYQVTLPTKSMYN